MTVERELGSVSQWLIELRHGDADAAAELWRRYFGRLTHLARRRMGSMPRRVADEEDVALSAFDSFCRAAEVGRFPKLDDRDDLWQVLVVIAARKAAAAARQARRQKRGRGLVRGHSCFGQAMDDENGWHAMVAEEPSPEVAAAVAEEYQRLMSALGDATLRSIAQWKLEGYSNEEIAGRLGRQTRTVERKLHLIRALWLESQVSRDRT